MPFEVTVERDNGLPPDQYRHHNADHVAHITAVAGKIGDQFDKKCKQRKDDEAPDKRPIGRFAFFHKQPTGKSQQRQRQGQAVQKHPKFHPAIFGIEMLLCNFLHLCQLAALTRCGLPRIKSRLLLRFYSSTGSTFFLLERIQRPGTCNQFRVLVGKLSRPAGG